MSSSPAVRIITAELAGTAVLVALGTGTIVEGDRAGSLPVSLLAFGWFLAVLVPVLLFARASGAHLNPAVTTALAASGRVRWAEVPFYLAGQLVGAFAGSAIVLLALGRGVRLGANAPAPGYLDGVLPAEIVGTALLVLTVFLIADRGEGARRWRLLLPAIAVGGLTYLAGPYTGISLNPARSLAPAILSGELGDLWMYLIGPVVGGLLVAVAWPARHRRHAPPPVTNA
ncbi:MAG: aquaporin family protein [Thermoplasmata archaeon]|nr:aquaporin family protein [Thermoplasmata archaeon]MCI4354320.1 aquaporin family protein [Thermoplasmata archaeon]